MIMFMCRAPSEIAVQTDPESTSNVEIPTSIRTSAETIKVTGYVFKYYLFFNYKIYCSLRH